MQTSEVVYIPEEHYNIIRLVSEGVRDVEQIAERLGRDVSALMRVLAELEVKSLVRTVRETVRYVELTDEGRAYAEVSLPELKLLHYVRDVHGDVNEISLQDYLKTCREILSEKMCNIVLSNLVRMGLVSVSEGVIKFTKGLEQAIQIIEERQRVLVRIHTQGRVEASQLPSDILQELHKRKLIKFRDRVRIRVELTEHALKLLQEGKLRPAKVVSALTPDMIRSGAWREVVLKEFDLRIEVPEAPVAVPHFMREFLKIVREIFIELGFEEVHGPIVEMEFWNFDALFQAQDHPAREIHDTFFLKLDLKGEVDPQVAERVAKTHEDGWVTGSLGWRYKWSLEKALRLILRTQTTAVTIRTLHERGEGEYRVFTIGKVFRPETLDPKHSMEFYQADGIVVGKSVNFKHLLGILETFARKLGLSKVMFKPAYFPFTCPSAEGYVWHEKLGWVEFVGCGVFRPEVTIPAGVKNCKVLAFGMGLDRLAMTLLEIDDIRELHTPDIEKLKDYYARLVKKLRLVK